MTASVATGILIQAAAVWLVHAGIRGEWMRRPAALMLALAVVGHGVTEVMQWIWPGRNGFRRFVSQAIIDDWVLIVSVVILLYAIAYVAVVRFREPEAEAESAEESAQRIVGLPLKWLLVLVAPLMVATVQGQGALQPVAPGQVQPVVENKATVDLATTFLVPLVSLIGAVILVRHGTRWMLVLFAAQGALLALAGTRSTIVTACLLSLVGARLCGVRPTRKQMAWTCVVVAFFTMLISSTRMAAGRETFTAGQGAEQRASGLVDGVAALPSPESREAILDDVVYRFDANTFGALVLQGLRAHHPPVGLETTKNNLLFLVPSSLAPGKLGNSLEERSEESFLDRRYGMSQRVDWLPGIFGTMLSYYGTAGLLLLALLFGAAMGAVERLALRVPTTARFLLLMGLAQGAFLYAAGPQAFLTSLRFVAVTVAFYWLVGLMRRTYVASTRPAVVAR